MPKSNTGNVSTFLPFFKRRRVLPSCGQTWVVHFCKRLPTTISFLNCHEYWLLKKYKLIKHGGHRRGTDPHHLRTSQCWWKYRSDHRGSASWHRLYQHVHSAQWFPDLIELDITIAKSHKNRIRKPIVRSPATDEEGYLQSESVLYAWVMWSDGFKNNPRELWEARMCRRRVGSVGAVIGTAGSSWARLGGEVYGFHSDGLSLTPPSLNVYTGPLKTGAQLRGERRESGWAIHFQLFQRFLICIYFLLLYPWLRQIDENVGSH